MAKIQEKNIDIKGMHCKSCVNLIESKVNSVKGVKNIKVDLIENKASVKFDPDKITLNKIKSEIEKIGYSTGKKPVKKSNNILQGIMYGLIPHIGCIVFIIGSILGVTLFTQMFKPLLMSRYFFYILLLISFGFATLSSFLYLRKNGFLSLKGMKREWKYLLSMYSSTILVNLLLFMVIFPMLVNASPSKNTFNTAGLQTIKLQVDIPCSGHASLISDELKKLNGVQGVKFNLPNIFDVSYDQTTTKDQILSLEVFKTYKATVLDESTTQQTIEGGSCGGCGGSCSSCGGSGCSESGCACGKQ